MQQITVEGVPATSHFAQVLVAADYRMKRLGMNLDPPPRGDEIAQLFADDAGKFIGRRACPRWWMEPKYDPLLAR